jgi:hypothetical protein
MSNRPHAWDRLQAVIPLLPLVTIYLLASVTFVAYVASAKGRSGLA